MLNAIPLLFLFFIYIAIAGFGFGWLGNLSRLVSIARSLEDIARHIEAPERIPHPRWTM